MYRLFERKTSIFCLIKMNLVANVIVTFEVTSLVTERKLNFILDKRSNHNYNDSSEMTVSTKLQFLKGMFLSDEC